MTQVHKCACHPQEDSTNPMPLGSPWIPHEEDNNDVEMKDMEGSFPEDEEDRLSDSSEASEHLEGDTTLANATLFIWNGIWWHEVCKAVANSDPGRVWEILKLWIFTFAGSSNTYYSQYLLELYCNFK
jgi:hypothetical protein